MKILAEEITIITKEEVWEYGSLVQDEESISLQEWINVVSEKLGIKHNN